MIVDPDFLDHWRTGMVVDALGDPMAPTYIMRLWAHCQERKSDTFVMPTRGLKAQCKCPGDAEVFEAAMIEAGFVERNGDTIKVTGWAEKNASLLAAWENGSKGGRPKKNPQETHGKPDCNPTETQEEPKANPGETDKSREEKNTSSLRSEVKPPRASRKASPTPMPEDFSISDAVRRWAGEKGFGQLDAHLEAFKDKAKAKSYTYVDWDAAFKTAIREDWGRIRQPPSAASFSSAANQGVTVPSSEAEKTAQMLREQDEARKQSQEAWAKRKAAMQAAQPGAIQ